MIGYVLLVTFAIIMGAIVYNWMKTYVPKDKIECPEGASLFITDVHCVDGTDNLSISLKNNGRFSLAGYFIRAANHSTQKIATIDLSGYGRGIGGMIKFEGPENSFGPSENETRVFKLNSEVNVTSIEIIPIRYDSINNKKTLEVCNNIKIKENIICPVI